MGGGADRHTDQTGTERETDKQTYRQRQREREKERQKDSDLEHFYTFTYKQIECDLYPLLRIEKLSFMDETCD